MRQRRLSLSIEQQKIAEQTVCNTALRRILTHKAKCVALYLPFDGEISTTLLIQQLWQANIIVCLPRLHPFSKGHLLFFRYTPTTTLQHNAFGILEPTLDITNLILLEQIDILFTPLVAFDNNGNRLGMGGGFYDRTLVNWQQQHFIPIGLAHRCQKVEQLPVESWDIPLADILVG